MTFEFFFSDCVFYFSLEWKKGNWCFSDQYTKRAIKARASCIFIYIFSFFFIFVICIYIYIYSFLISIIVEHYLMVNNCILFLLNLYSSNDMFSKSDAKRWKQEGVIFENGRKGQKNPLFSSKIGESCEQIFQSRIEYPLPPRSRHAYVFVREFLFKIFCCTTYLHDSNLVIYDPS
jgi:hypothetical protein